MTCPKCGSEVVIIRELIVVGKDGICECDSCKHSGDPDEFGWSEAHTVYAGNDG